MLFFACARFQSHMQTQKKPGTMLTALEFKPPPCTHRLLHSFTVERFLLRSLMSSQDDDRLHPASPTRRGRGRGRVVDERESSDRDSSSPPSHSRLSADGLSLQELLAIKRYYTGGLLQGSTGEPELDSVV